MKILFIAKRGADGLREGEDGWTVLVDNKPVCELDADEMDVSDMALVPMWKALGVTVEFDSD